MTLAADARATYDNAEPARTIVSAVERDRAREGVTVVPAGAVDVTDRAGGRRRPRRISRARAGGRRGRRSGAAGSWWWGGRR